jgi:hypothetical protein
MARDGVGNRANAVRPSAPKREQAVRRHVVHRACYAVLRLSLVRLEFLLSDAGRLRSHGRDGADCRRIPNRGSVRIEDSDFGYTDMRVHTTLLRLVRSMSSLESRP